MLGLMVYDMSRLLHMIDLASIYIYRSINLR